MKERAQLVSMVLAGGNYHYVPGSSVLAVHAAGRGGGGIEIDSLMRVARSTDFTIMAMPEDTVVEYGNSVLKRVVDAFIAMNYNPSFLLSIKIMPELFISDDTIYAGKTFLIDKEGLLQSIICKGLKWFSVKNDDLTVDPLMEAIIKDVTRERGLLAMTVVLNTLGLKNLSDLVILLNNWSKGP